MFAPGQFSRKNLPGRDVESHISRKTSEMWGTRRLLHMEIKGWGLQLPARVFG
jgi:hypothetical protein